MPEDGPSRFLFCLLVDFDSRPHETCHMRLGETRGMRLYRVNMDTVNQHMGSMKPKVSSVAVPKKQSSINKGFRIV